MNKESIKWCGISFIQKDFLLLLPASSEETKAKLKEDMDEANAWFLIDHCRRFGCTHATIEGAVFCDQTTDQKIVIQESQRLLPSSTLLLHYLKTSLAL